MSEKQPPQSTFDYESTYQFAPDSKATNLEDIAKLETELYSAVATLKEYLESMKIRIDEFGAATGKLMVRHLEDLNLPNQSRKNRANAFAAIKRMHRFYKGIYGNEYPLIQNGFLAEYATAQCLSEQVGYPVAYPTQEEDRDGKVDLWLDLEDGRVMAIQVKSLPIKGDHQDLVFIVETEQDIDEILNRLGSAVHNPDQFKRNALAMLHYCNQFSNVIPTYIIMPSAGSEDSRFNIITGEPDRKLANDLYRELEEKVLH